MSVNSSSLFLRLSLILMLMVTCQLSMLAQFNVRIGYSLGFVNPNVTNDLMAMHQTNNESFFDEYLAADRLRMMYGITLGTRYKFGRGSLELSWQNLSRERKSVGFQRPDPPLQPTSISEEFKYGMSMFMLTYENTFGRIGLGTSVGRNFVTVNQTTTNGQDSVPLLISAEQPRPSHYVGRIHLAYNFFGNNTVSFAIKPYVQFGLTDLDISPLSSNLGIELEDTQESFPLIGISFAFYNGKQ